jgi:glycosyltransferase involved in cell wall biosynthesis
MRYGRPIITSDLDFAREICGEAAEYFDPLDPESIFTAIARVRDDSGRRDQLVAAGKKQQDAMPGSWDEIARTVMAKLTALAEA